MDAFMGALIRMSLRGVVIIFVVLSVRLLLKKLRISHKYILGLWIMAFLYFIFPWKLSRLQFGMPIEEVEGILDSSGMYTFRTADESVNSEGYAVCLSAQYSQYSCYFDSQISWPGS